ERRLVTRRRDGLRRDLDRVRDRVGRVRDPADRRQRDEQRRGQRGGEPKLRARAPRRGREAGEEGRGRLTARGAQPALERAELSGAKSVHARTTAARGGFLTGLRA